MYAVVLCRVNSQDRGCLRGQQTPHRTAGFEDAVVIQFIEPDEHVLVAFGILLEQFVKGPEFWNRPWTVGLRTPTESVV